MEWWYVDNKESYVTDDYDSACEYAADYYDDEWIGDDGLTNLFETRVMFIDGPDELYDHCETYHLNIYDYFPDYDNWVKEQWREAYENEQYDRHKDR